MFGLCKAEGFLILNAWLMVSSVSRCARLLSIRIRNDEDFRFGGCSNAGQHCGATEARSRKRQRYDGILGIRSSGPATPFGDRF